MALEPQLDSLEGLNEALHGEYVEREGKFYLDVSGGIPDVSTLEGTLAKVRDELKESKQHAKSELDKYKDVDLEAIEEMRKKTAVLEAEREKAEEDKLLAAHDFEQVLSNRIEKRDADWKNKFDEKDNIIAGKDGTIEALKQRALQGELTMQLSGIEGMHSKGRRDALKAAMTEYTLDDKGRAVMLDSEGEVVIGKDGKTPFSLNEQADSPEYREENIHWYLASAHGAGGMVRGKFDAGAHNSVAGLSRIQRIERQLELNAKNR